MLTLFCHGMDVIKIPQPLAIASHSHLKSVIIGENVVFLFRLSGFHLHVGRCVAWEPMVYSSAGCVFQKIAGEGLEYHVDYTGA